MSSEMMALSALVLWQMVVGLLAVMVIGKVTGTDWLLSSRETAVDFRGGLAGRMARARDNGIEALTLFTPTVVVVAHSGVSSTVTATAAWVFVAARVLYVACYAFDLVPWRTLVWFVGAFAVLTMVLTALVGG